MFKPSHLSLPRTPTETCPVTLGYCLVAGLTWLVLSAPGEADLDSLVGQLRLDASRPRLTGLVLHPIYHREGWHLLAVILGMLLVGAPLELRLGSRRFLVLLGLSAGGTAVVAAGLRLVASTLAEGDERAWILHGGGSLVLACLALRSLVPAPENLPGILDRPHLDWVLILLAASGLVVLDGLPVDESTRTFLLPQIAGVFWGGVFVLALPAASRHVRRRQRRRDLQLRQEKERARERVNLLLEKISRGGLDSLTRRERLFLEQASKHFSRDA